MLKKILIFLGLGPTEDEQKIIDAMKRNNFKTLRVSRKGGVSVEAYEVYQTDSHKDALEKARRIVENSRRRK